MPVNMGNEDSGGFDGLTGNFVAKPVEVADKLVQGREDRPDAVRVTFQIQGKDDKLSLFVPLSERAPEVLRPFIPNVKQVPTDEAGLRSFLAANMPGTEFLVYASNSSIRGTTAKPGKVRVQLTGLHQFSRQSDGQKRARFFAETKNHETVTWTVRYPAIVCKVGQTPDQDDIGPEKEFNPNPYLFEYLIAFGLDWGRLVQEVTQAYEDGKLFSRLGLDGPEPGYFSNPDDLTDELFQAAKRHNPNRWCEVVLVDHQQYGIGPKRGDYSHIEFTPVIVEGGGADDAEFTREVASTMEQWDLLTKVIYGDGDARFMVGGKFTDQGRDLALSVLKPLVLAYPAAVTGTKADGTPEIVLPPNADSWTLDGVACLYFTAKRLLKLSEEGNDKTLMSLVNLTDHEGKKVVAWAKENVPEWATIGQESEAEVL